MVVEEPIDVPAELDRDELSDMTQGLQQVMDSVYERAEGLKAA